MEREIFCHAANLFFEARGESSLGQRWVLDVVANRVASDNYADDYCGVITQSFQFSWYGEHLKGIPTDPLFWEDYIYKMYRNNILEIIAWHRCFQKAMDHMIYRSGGDISDGSLYYMTTEAYYSKRKGKPWNRTKVSNTIGKHIFFNRCNRGSSQCSHF
jgi:hypothetical protein